MLERDGCGSLNGEGAAWVELAGHLLSRVPEKAVDREGLTPLQKLPKREWEKLLAAGYSAGLLVLQKPGAGGV